MTLFEKLNGAIGANFSSSGLAFKSKIRKLASNSDQKVKPEKRDEHNRWVKIQTSGIVPSPRSGHDVAVIDNKVYLFGGCGGENDAIACLNDMYIFDLSLHKWSKVQYNGDVKPTARASFGMCTGLTSDSIIVAGGTGVEMDSLRSDVLEFDTRTREWTKLKSNADDSSSRFYGQTVCRYENSLLFFGGSTGLHYTNDLYEHNLCTNSWRKLTTTGRSPSPRYKHQSVIVGNCMYVIGGGCFKPEFSVIDMYCLNLNTLVWTDPSMNGSIPCARVAHSCSFDHETSTIYLWGGFTGELSRLHDFFSYNTKTLEWSEIKTASIEKAPNSSSPNSSTMPNARAFHSAAYHDGALYIFSGANGDIRYNDIWRYNLRSSPPSLSTLAARALVENRVGVQQMLELDFFVPREVLTSVMKMNEGATELY